MSALVRTRRLLAVACALACFATSAQPVLRDSDVESLKLAIRDLRETYPHEYREGAEFERRLARLEEDTRALRTGAESHSAALTIAAQFKSLRRAALFANPLLRFEKLLIVKHDTKTLRLPRNDACYSSIPRTGYDCEILSLSPVKAGGKLTSFFKADGGKYLSDIDLSFDANKMLFTMSGSNHWEVFEINADGSGLKQMTSSPHDDFDCFDACYLPNGKIIFCSTANYQSVPCYNGTRRLGGLYLMEADGSNVRQLTFDQDDDSYPSVMNNGRVVYTRWEYAGTPHFFTRLLFQMNPDGSGQEELYGSNSYWPNAIYGARSLPGDPTKIVGIVSGHHGDRRMGELIIFDPSKGRQEAKGVVQRIPGRGKPVEPVIKDTLVNESWPKFMNPWPLSDKYFLVACKPTRKSDWGIYLADVFDNLVPLCEVPGCALLEAVPFVPRPKPPVLPEVVKRGGKDALVYMVDVYSGGGLRGVPRGTIKNLRVISPHYGYFGNAGWLNIAIDGAWDVQRILGTVPVHEDGSAYFRVPANTPISVQPLDGDGKAVQLMRSWFTAMPGEIKTCAGCHEGGSQAAPNMNANYLARGPDEIAPWHGPSRGLSFERDVQPVLDAHCVRCHNDKPQADGTKICDLRALKFFPDYKGVLAPIPQVITNGFIGLNISEDDMGVETCDLSERHLEPIRFSPAYETLHRYVRRGGSESDGHMLMPYEFHADTSELVQMLRKGHYGVQLDNEAWDRLITWIDLNVPCHGTWNEVYPVPFNGHERRLEYLKFYGGVDDDYETIPDLPKYVPTKPTRPLEQKPAQEKKLQRDVAVFHPTEREFDLGNGVSMKMVRVPDGFWIGKFEVRNCEYAQFDSSHDSGYISQLSTAVTSRGYPVNAPDQPVVRVSWNEATKFCEWLSRRTGLKFSLPSDEQWEYACRAGTSGRFWFGDNADFSKFANMADRKLEEMARRVPEKFLYSDHPDWVLRDNSCFDGALVTTNVGSYLPNPWGLHDMHGNAAEWTRTEEGSGRKIVHGGSWYDRPQRCTVDYTVSYPSWQAVYNVGFRVVCEPDKTANHGGRTASAR